MPEISDRLLEAVFLSTIGELSAELDVRGVLAEEITEEQFDRYIENYKRDLMEAEFYDYAAGMPTYAEYCYKPEVQVIEADISLQSLLNGLTSPDE